MTAPSPPPVAAERQEGLDLIHMAANMLTDRNSLDAYLSGRLLKWIKAALSGALEPTTDYQDGWNVGHAEGFELGLRSREAAAAEQVTAERERVARALENYEALLKDPNAVHLNMLRGGIAKPSWEQIKHLYPDQFASPAPADQAGQRGSAICCNCDNSLSCASCGVEVPDDSAEWEKLEASADQTVKALEAIVAAHDNLFAQCCSNEIKNAWGKEVDVSLINEARRLADAALQTIRGGK